jgi:hypothetical protein
MSELCSDIRHLADNLKLCKVIVFID